MSFAKVSSMTMPFVEHAQRATVAETGADDREETEDGEPAAANEADVPHTKFVIWHREMTHEKAQALIAVWV